MSNKMSNKMSNNLSNMFGIIIVIMLAVFLFILYIQRRPTYCGPIYGYVEKDECSVKNV